MTPLIVLAVWLALNILATRSLLQLGDRIRMPRMRIAMVWIVPFMGACMSFLETTAARRQLRHEGDAAPTRTHEPPPDDVSAGGAISFPLRPHLSNVHGFAMLDWSAAATWL